MRTTREGAMRKIERKKTMRFDMLTVGDKFEIPLADAGMVFAKTSSRKAIADGDANADAFMVKPSDEVLAYVTVEVPSPEEKEARHVEGIRHTLAGWQRSGDEAAEALKKAIDSDPLRAMEWADKSFDAFGRKAVATILLQIIDHPEHGMDVARKVAREEALRGARWPSHSTSLTANRAAEAKTAAFAEFAADEETFLAYRDREEE